MENNSESSNANSEKILQEFDGVYDLLNRYITTIINDEVKADDDPLDRSIAEILRDLLGGKIIKFRQYIQENFESFENNELTSMLINHLRTFHGSILAPGNRNGQEHQKNVLDSTKKFIEKFDNIKLSIISQHNTKNLILNFEKQVERAMQSAQNYESAILALQSKETDKIYKDLSEKYEDEYDINNKYFTYSLIITACFTVLSIAYTFKTPFNEINWLAFITMKILIIAVGITLCTLFLRRSVHAKKLYEKAYQTHVEINAYPVFINSLEVKDKQEITKELALRYFGNNIDQTQNDKIGDLMQDQLSAGTELIKASAELVKAKQGNGEG